ncbi:response regulator [Candidatus Nitrospira salsa]|nr:MAG: DNA-binding response regulator [Nitrospirales bacterium]
MKKRPTILLADDHTMVLEGLSKILAEDYTIVGLVEDGRALIQSAQKLEPDVIVLDISMPLLNGLEAARQLNKLLPRTKFIFLTMHADPAYATQAFDAGASGFLLKRSAAEELTQAIQAVLKDQFYVTPVIAKDFLLSVKNMSPRTPSSSPINTLTPRQREVLQLVAEGKSIKEAASILNISNKTVEFHKSRIMQELHVHTTAELTKYALAQGVISSE